MIELYQAEWCPFSRRVRQRLTELGVDFLARQVAADKDDRSDLERATGTRSIPVLVLADGSTIAGSDEILQRLDELYPENAQTQAHQAQARAHA